MWSIFQQFEALDLSGSLKTELFLESHDRALRSKDEREHLLLLRKKSEVMQTLSPLTFSARAATLRAFTVLMLRIPAAASCDSSNRKSVPASHLVNIPTLKQRV